MIRDLFETMKPRTLWDRTPLCPVFLPFALSTKCGVCYLCCFLWKCCLWLQAAKEVWKFWFIWGRTEVVVKGCVCWGRGGVSRGDVMTWRPWVWIVWIHFKAADLRTDFMICAFQSLLLFTSPSHHLVWFSLLRLYNLPAPHSSYYLTWHSLGYYHRICPEVHADL